jgi:hypothetical protein
MPRVKSNFRARIVTFERPEGPQDTSPGRSNVGRQANERSPGFVTNPFDKALKGRHKFGRARRSDAQSCGPTGREAILCNRRPRLRSARGLQPGLYTFGPSGR